MSVFLRLGNPEPKSLISHRPLALTKVTIFFFICSHPTVSSSPLAAGGRRLPGKCRCSKSRACNLSNQLMFHCGHWRNISPACSLLYLTVIIHQMICWVKRKVKLSRNGSNSCLFTGLPPVGGAQLRLGAAISLFLSTF